MAVTEKELRDEVERLAKTPEVISYQKAKEDLYDFLENKKENNINTFLEELLPVVLKTIQSIKLPNPTKHELWLSSYQDYDDDFIVDTTDLITFFDKYAAKTGNNRFSEIGHNCVIKIYKGFTKNAIELCEQWDDGHYTYDIASWAYVGDINTITVKDVDEPELTDSEVRNAL
jgi:hypothetical protein